jgi:hypothetical protein
VGEVIRLIAQWRHRRAARSLPHLLRLCLASRARFSRRQKLPPLLHDPKTEGKPGAFCQWGNGRTVHTPRWRLTERRDGFAELYDHSTDPDEYHNLIANPDHAPLVKRLHGMLDQEFGPMAKAPAGKAKVSGTR